MLAIHSEGFSKGTRLTTACGRATLRGRLFCWSTSFLSLPWPEALQQEHLLRPLHQPGKVVVTISPNVSFRSTGDGVGPPRASAHGGRSIIPPKGSRPWRTSPSGG